MKWWQKLFNIPTETEYVYINTDAVCPECTKKCPEDKLWAYYVTFVDHMTGNTYTYITEKGKLFLFRGWTNLTLTSIDDVSMDISNKHLLNKLVKVKVNR